MPLTHGSTVARLRLDRRRSRLSLGKGRESLISLFYLSVFFRSLVSLRWDQESHLTWVPQVQEKPQRSTRELALLGGWAVTGWWGRWEKSQAHLAGFYHWPLSSQVPGGSQDPTPGSPRHPQPVGQLQRTSAGHQATTHGGKCLRSSALASFCLRPAGPLLMPYARGQLPGAKPGSPWL